jgi:hypothetical protein
VGEAWEPSNKKMLFLSSSSVRKGLRTTKAASASKAKKKRKQKMRRAKNICLE